MCTIKGPTAKKSEKYMHVHIFNQRHGIHMSFHFVDQLRQIIVDQAETISTELKACYTYEVSINKSDRSL